MADGLAGLALRRSWPRGEVDLLIRAAVAPPAEASRAWRQWTKARNFDDVTWPEIRLLGPLSLRLAELDPESPLRPRIAGIAKRFWTKTQLKLQAAGEIFDALGKANLPFLVFKGAAQYAEGFAPTSRRIMGDVDVLVPRARITEAVEVLTGSGWASVNGESPEYLRYLSLIRLSGNYRKGENGEIDLHSELFHYERRDTAVDRALWERAGSHCIGSRTILVPDPTDSVLIGLAHAAVGRSGDWAVDISSRLAHQAIDWDRLVETAGSRGLATACLAGLRYLRELAVDIPDTALAGLARTTTGFGEVLKHWSNVRERSERNVIEKIANAAANATLRGKGFSYFLKDTRAVAVKRPTLPMPWLLRRGRIAAVGPDDWATRHELALTAAATGRRLVLSLAIHRPANRRRFFFDVIIDGRPVARLRGRSRGYRPGSRRRLLFAFGVPALDRAALTIIARPAGFLAPDATEEARGAIAPLDFRLDRVWVA
jgi:hypothetical protein